MTLLTLGPREPQGDADALVKPQPTAEAPEEPESAVLTPTAAQVVALAVSAPSAAACRRMSTQSSTSTAGARARGRGRASSFSPLQRVEYVEVSAKLRRDGHSLYVVDVYLQRRSERQRLSDCAYSAAGSALSREALDEVMRAERESDYRVEHRFREFAQLRSRLRALVEPSPTHDSTKCADCRELHALGARRRYQALQLRRVFSTERSRRELLASLVNDALDLAARFSDLLEEEEEEQLASNNEKLAPAECEARVKAVALVDDFLRKPFSSSLGII